MAEHAASLSPQLSSHAGSPSRPRSGTMSRPACGRRQSTTAASSGRLKKQPPNDKEFLISRADAQWFLELPDPIRRKYFTWEEQMLLAGTCESVILDAADEALYKAGPQANRSMSNVEDARTSKFDLERSHNPSANGKRASMVEGFAWMDTNSDLDLSLDDYHSHLSQSRPLVAHQESAVSKRPSFKRSTSMRGRSLGYLSMSSMDHQPPHSPLSHRVRPQIKHRSISDRTVPHSSKTLTPDLEPEAAYYQDPQARLKLRVYLGSPQKFDEALEFGFPSIDTSKTTTRASSPSRRSSRDAYHDAIRASSNGTDCSPLDDAEHDFESVTEVDSSSRPRNGLRNHPDNPYAQGFAGDREMTLRMTLTRPDLRADESVLYGWKTKPNVNSLPEETMLPSSDSPCGVMGPFGGPDGWGDPPKDDGVVTRLWRKVMPRSSKADIRH